MTERAKFSMTVTTPQRREIFRRRSEGKSIRDISSGMRINYDVVADVCANKITTKERTDMLYRGFPA